ncbi:ABC transporter ATP-binding protein [Lentilactobacillus hilgardii]|jgi:ABC-2 type transport system ATP-binding protein|uniref:ATP-binding cassette domain-containing protein n=1 Tax=Lentilactobacillus hilgardii TaxID=1588 RepID=A0A6P1E8X2_LENHI|nr:ATP-binding cassette domain-containing protein [Lentilactobacillus hilgardii]EEI72348.1 ABC transporter, ATP-binding protein [Lentilactobacillus hilgardii ATCC 27305]MCT3392335.1 ATP-binding cassette domain-containing protein [Lentilactobacillus hilgardii]QHB53248.1 ATP-binding cassette domain-containing protein [Lentilactobacillus hilgardii]RRG07833.1 MAG: ATP-binding cassette domain-containing protein [Lactobacillus sp.]
MSETILKVQKLNKSFGSKQVLHDISLNGQKGHVIGLVGANGAGKTTLMKAILGLTSAQGTISIDGQLSSFDHHEILKRVGALIEYPSIYPFISGRDHLTLFAKGPDRKQHIQKTIKELHLTKYIDRPAKKYSLGMKQKLGIAMAMVNEPELVILDEPMNGLDPQANKELRLLIKAKSQSGTTFLISSHILSELQKVADELLILDHGRIIQETTMKDLLAASDHYLILSTSNDPLARKVLTQAGYHLVSDSELKIHVAAKVNLEPILKALDHQKITVLDIQHQDGGLEESVLKLLNEDQLETEGQK